jgi:hypothetical protein
VYKAAINRATPGLILVAVDQSAAMAAPSGGVGGRRIDRAAASVNRFVNELLSFCEKGEEKPRNYFAVGLVGYSADEAGRPVIGPVLGGALAGRDLVSVVDLYDHPLEIERRKKAQDDGAGGRVECEIHFPVWYRPPAPSGGAPLCAALANCRRIAGEWVTDYPGNFPPIVLNLTSGGACDGDPTEAARGLMDVATADGKLLLVNCVVGDGGPPVVAPGEPQPGAETIFRMSSPVPEPLRQKSEMRGNPLPAGARLFTRDNGLDWVCGLFLSTGHYVPVPDHLR